jgi:hypothetical protein
LTYPGVDARRDSESRAAKHAKGAPSMMSVRQQATPSHGANGVVGVTECHSKGRGVEHFGAPVKSFWQIARVREGS